MPALTDVADAALAVVVVDGGDGDGLINRAGPHRLLDRCTDTRGLLQCQFERAHDEQHG